MTLTQGLIEAPKRPAQRQVERVKTATLAQLEIIGAEIAYSEHIGATEAARKALIALTPDPETAQHLVLVGLAREIQEILDADRVDAANPERVKQAARAGIRPPRALTGDVLADLVLVGIEGRPKALLRFDLEDWQHLAAISKGELDGANRRLETAKLATSLLDAEAKTTTADLSDKAKNTLRSAVAGAWK